MYSKIVGIFLLLGVCLCAPPKAQYSWYDLTQTLDKIQPWTDLGVSSLAGILSENGDVAAASCILSVQRVMDILRQVADMAYNRRWEVREIVDLSIEGVSVLLLNGYEDCPDIVGTVTAIKDDIVNLFEDYKGWILVAKNLLFQGLNFEFNFHELKYMWENNHLYHFGQVASRIFYGTFLREQNNLRLLSPSSRIIPTVPGQGNGWEARVWRVVVPIGRVFFTLFAKMQNVEVAQCIDNAITYPFILYNQVLGYGTEHQTSLPIVLLQLLSFSLRAYNTCPYMTTAYKPFVRVYENLRNDPDIYIYRLIYNQFSDISTVILNVKLMETDYSQSKWYEFGDQIGSIFYYAFVQNLDDTPETSH